MADINYYWEAFSANDTYLSAPDLHLGGTNFTFAFWLKGEYHDGKGGRAGGSNLFSQNDGAAEHMIFGYEMGGTRVVWKFGVGDNGVHASVPYDNDDETDLQALGDWQHWTGVLASDGNGGWRRQLFYNGDNLTNASASPGYTGSGNLTIGHGSLPHTYLGIDNFIIFKRALSAEEIDLLFRQDEDFFRNDVTRRRNLSLLYRFHQQPDWAHRAVGSVPGPFGYGIAHHKSRFFAFEKVSGCS